MSEAARGQAAVDDGVARAIESAAPRADFVALLGLLGRLTPAAAPIGGDGPPHLEAIRLRHDPGLGLRPGEISEATRAADGRWSVTTAFLGLTGAVSPLPLYLCEEVLQADNDRLRDFLDLFHHRLLSLLYRLLVRDRGDGEYTRDAGDRWSRRLLALAGLDAPTSRIPATTRLQLVALRVNLGGTTHALTHGLRLVLGDALGDPAALTVTPFIEEWVEVDARQRLRLGRSRLADDVVLGRRLRSASGRIRITVRAQEGTQFRRFLPGGDLLPIVDEALHLIVDSPVDYELDLIIPGERAPALLLSAARPPSLGRDTWLAGRCDRDTHIIVNPRRAAGRRRHED